MPIKTLDIPALAAEFTAPHPNLDPRQQRLAPATFRLLGEGVHDVVPDGAAMTLHAVNGFDLNDVVGTFWLGLCRVSVDCVRCHSTIR